MLNSIYIDYHASTAVFFLASRAAEIATPSIHVDINKLLQIPDKVIAPAGYCPTVRHGRKTAIFVFPLA